MTKEELINEMLRQGMEARSRVEIVIKERTLIGCLSDAKVHIANDGDKFGRIGFILEPPSGMINPPIPVPINVEEIDSIKRI